MSRGNNIYEKEVRDELYVVILNRFYAKKTILKNQLRKEIIMKKRMLFIIVSLLMVTVYVYLIGCDSLDKKVVDSNLGTGIALGPIDTFPGLPDPPSPLPYTFSITDFSVTIVSVIIDTTNAKVTYYMAVYDSNDTTEYRFITDYYENANIFGHTTTLKDTSGNLLWEYDVSVDTSNSEILWLNEKTTSDSMDIQRIISSTTRTEIYNINGSVDTFVFDTTDSDTIRALQELLSSNRSSFDITEYSGLDSQILATLVDFHDFYESDNTLHNNTNGEIVTDLIVNQDFGDWFYNSYADTTQQLGERPDWASTLCTIMEICTAVKCPEGVNPICGPCAAGAITCKIMDLFDLWDH